ncbi:hypothetical protein [Sphingomonas sp.]|uniref:hypothetical protein n=1 Tax=Sphingomonas sp. TaxID=28214 RepID=UPI003B3AA677
MSVEPRILADTRILVLEDDYYLATDLQASLEAAGATVIGPFSDEAEAALALTAQPTDYALIDVNLGQGASFEIAQILKENVIPFAFVTGYDAGIIPDRYAAVPRFEKPVDIRKVISEAARQMRGRPR